MIEAKKWALGTSVVPVDVWDRISRVFRPVPEERGDHCDARRVIQDDCVFEQPAEAYGYPDGVPPAEWLELAFPAHVPAHRAEDQEARPCLTHAFDLLPDRQVHQSSSPSP